ARDQLGQVHASRVQDRLRADRAVDRSVAAGVELRHAATASGESIVSPRANCGLERRAPGLRAAANGQLLTRHACQTFPQPRRNRAFASDRDGLAPSHLRGTTTSGAACAAEALENQEGEPASAKATAGQPSPAITSEGW